MRAIRSPQHCVITIVIIIIIIIIISSSSCCDYALLSPSLSSSSPYHSYRFGTSVSPSRETRGRKRYPLYIHANRTSSD